MYLAPDRYLEQTVLRQMITTMIEAVCKDKPSSLRPYLFHFLKEKYPADAAALPGLEAKEAELGPWEPREDIASSQEALAAFLTSLGVRHILEVVLEGALREQPQNAVAFVMYRIYLTTPQGVPPPAVGGPPTPGGDEPAVATLSPAPEPAPEGTADAVAEALAPEEAAAPEPAATAEETPPVTVAEAEGAPVEAAPGDAAEPEADTAEPMTPAEPAAEVLVEAAPLAAAELESATEPEAEAAPADESDPTSQVFAALGADDAAKATAALAADAPVGATNPAGQTALHLAAEGETAVPALLAEGYPVDAAGGASAEAADSAEELMTACAEESGDAEIIKAVTGKEEAVSEPVPPPAGSRSMSKRPSFSSESVDPATIDRSTLPVVDKGAEAQARIHEVVGSNLLFKDLDEATLSATVMAMRERIVAAGEAVLTQGEGGACFYIVDSGALEVFKYEEGDQPSAQKPGAKVGELGEKDSFGETALMNDSPSETTVLVTADVVLWCLDRDTFRALQLSAAVRAKDVLGKEAA